MTTPSNGSIICKLGIKPSRLEPTAYTPSSVFANAPADVLEKRIVSDHEYSAEMLIDVERGHSTGDDSHRFSSVPPEQTTTPCQWCMHTFTTLPVGLPFKKNSSGGFDTFGTFCSLECASAFNFDKLHGSHTAFTRHTMCCEIATMQSQQTVRPVRIVPAPPREMLRLFGGPSTIDEFRKKDVAYTIVYPLPISAKHQHSESLAFTSTDISGPRFVPIEDETIDTLTSGLRRPPVSKKGYRSTLDYMCAPSS
jgi:hypothetical protein